MMMVRSQNGSFVTFLENIQGTEIYEESGKSVRLVFEYIRGSKTMGYYRSFQVALKVLSMIQEEWINGSKNFNMPDDTEV